MISYRRFELYERNHGRGKSDKEYSIKLSLSEGAHSSNVLDSSLDARHALNVQPRRSAQRERFDVPHYH
jgi:inositol hexakisphosphate/diphosphoinositol-pentakisphosphate kinase